MNLNSSRIIPAALAGFVLIFKVALRVGAQNWTQTSSPTNYWSCVASSADGSKVAAVVNGGLIYCSTNSGVTWTPTSAPNQNWNSVASSADGIKLVAGAHNGPIYISTNSGTSWAMANVPNYDWSVTCDWRER